MNDEFINRFGLKGEPGEIADYGADDLPDHPTVPPGVKKKHLSTTEFDDDVKPKIAEHPEVLNRQLLFNGETFDRQRNNSYQVIKPKGTIYGSGSYYFPMAKNYNWRGASFVLYYQYTSVVGTQIQFLIQGYDPASGQWHTNLLSPGLVVETAYPYTFKMYPGIATNPGYASSDILMRYWRCGVVLGGAGTTGYLFSISANLIV